MRRSVMVAAMVVAVVAAACGGADDASPGDEDTTTTATSGSLSAAEFSAAVVQSPLAATGATSMRQERIITVTGPGADSAGLTGDYGVLTEVTSAPAPAMRMELQSPVEEAAVAALNGGITEIVIIDDSVWVHSLSDQWVSVEEVPENNPLLGPFGPIIDGLVQATGSSGGALTRIGVEEIDGRATTHYRGGGFSAMGPQGQAMPIASMDVWIDDEAMFLTRAEVVTTGGDPATGTDFEYRVTYRTFDLGAAVTVESPE